MMNDLVLNRLFTRTSFRNLINDKNGQEILTCAAKRCEIETDNKTNREIIEELYKYISNNYRNEYYYKNLLLNKYVFGKYKPTTTAALTEVTVGKAKADFVLINGKAIVYEIKTELDNLERLSKQINEYYRAFRYVTVITYLDNYETVIHSIDNPHVGVCAVNESGRIDRRHEKKPEEYREKLDYKSIFQILRKYEYEGIISDVIGKLPNCPSFLYYDTCFSLIRDKFSVAAFQMEMEKKIKERSQIDINRIKRIPKELKNIAYFSDYKNEEYNKIESFLNSMYKPYIKEVSSCTSQF